MHLRRISRSFSSRVGQRRTTALLPKETRVLINLSSQNQYDPIETAVATGVLQEVLERSIAADFAVMRDRTLNPKSEWNMGRIEIVKGDQAYVTYSDKLFPRAEYSSMGLPVFGSTWVSLANSKHMVLYPSRDVAPSALTDVNLRLTTEDPGYKWRGPLVSDTEFRRLKENMPVQYFVTLEPQLPQWAFANVDERTTVAELQSVIQAMWPTVQPCKTVVIHSPDFAVHAGTRVRELKGRRFSALIDGAEFKFNGGKHWNDAHYDWNMSERRFWLLVIFGSLGGILLIGVFAPRKEDEGDAVARERRLLEQLRAATPGVLEQNPARYHPGQRAVQPGADGAPYCFNCGPGYDGAKCHAMSIADPRARHTVHLNGATGPMLRATAPGALVKDAHGVMRRGRDAPVGVDPTMTPGDAAKYHPGETPLPTSRKYCFNCGPGYDGAKCQAMRTFTFFYPPALRNRATEDMVSAKAPGLLLRDSAGTLRRGRQ